MLGAMLMTQHNLHYYQALMQAMRQRIAMGRFGEFQALFAARYWSLIFVYPDWPSRRGSVDLVEQVQHLLWNRFIHSRVIGAAQGDVHVLALDRKRHRLTYSH